MEEAQPSSTAVVMAMVRAAHLLLDGEPSVLRDELALRLSGAKDEESLRSSLGELQQKLSVVSGEELAESVFKYARASITMRSRYVEDELEKAIHHGIRQYVILGAGLDSFAYRRPDLADTIQVYEVDHPVTQAMKLARLREVEIEPPPHVHFVALDLEKEMLTAGLKQSGFSLEERGFISWVGVTQYLTENAIFAILDEVASMAPGTEIICGYVVPDSQLDVDERRLAAIPKADSARRGEPWLSSFDPARLAARLEGVGFEQASDFGPDEANARYFADRSDGLYVTGIEHLMKATVR